MRPGGVAPSAWVVSVTEHKRNPGMQRELRVAAPLPGLGLSSATVPDGADVEAELELEALTDGRIVVTGVVRAPWTGECRRCLEPVTDVVTAEVREVFEPHPPDGAETYRLDGEQLDLEPMVRDAVLLALPIAPLCATGCAGPDPDAHPVAVAAEDADDAPPPDPRWSALGDLKFD
ncbi:MAG: DUF177 domain-containing protein [Acidimicrobiia bacterium]|nr:DUF177 domain-containing protein [Acidimicrobiia bacterium]